MMTKTKYDVDRKGTKTTQSLMIRVMIIDECQGHKCTFTQVVYRAYKQMNSSTVLFTLDCTHSLAFKQAEGINVKLTFVYIHICFMNERINELI